MRPEQRTRPAIPHGQNTYELPAQSSFVFYACKPRLEFAYETQSDAKSRK